MISTPYGPVLESDEAWDIIIGRLRAVGLEYSAADSVVWEMANAIIADPEMDGFVRECEDDDFAEWLNEVLDRISPTD